MRSYRQAIAVALATFFASLLGMALRLVVPAQVLNDSKATVGGMAGLTTLGDAQKLVNRVGRSTGVGCLQDSSRRG